MTWKYFNQVACMRPLTHSLPFVPRFSLQTLVFCLLLAGVPLSSQAQNFGSGEDSYINTFARPGEPTMTVYLWGTVGRTGIWQVARDADLIEFLSAVQVPGIGQEDRTIRRRITLRVYRGGAGERREVYNQRLDYILERGAAYPDLQDGDVLLVETEQRRRFFTFQTITSIVSTAASLTLLILRLTRGRF